MLVPDWLQLLDCFVFRHFGSNSDGCVRERLRVLCMCMAHFHIERAVKMRLCAQCYQFAVADHMTLCNGREFEVFEIVAISGIFLWKYCLNHIHLEYFRIFQANYADYRLIWCQLMNSATRLGFLSLPMPNNVETFWSTLATSGLTVAFDMRPVFTISTLTVC